MFRNQYDREITSFSPEGQLLQLEYAENASKNGKLISSLKSLSHTVLIYNEAKKDSITKHTNKILLLNENIMVGFCGIVGDGRLIYDLIKNKAKNYEFGNNIIIPIHLIASIFSKVFHTNTLYQGTRPFGIDLLLVGYDKSGPIIFEINQTQCSKHDTGSAIGKENEFSKKTINCLENVLENSSIDEILIYTLVSIAKKKENNQKIFVEQEKIVIGLVGKNTKATIFNYRITKFLTKYFNFLAKNQMISCL